MRIAILITSVLLLFFVFLFLFNGDRPYLSTNLNIQSNQHGSNARDAAVIERKRSSSAPNSIALLDQQENDSLAKRSISPAPRIVLRLPPGAVADTQSVRVLAFERSVPYARRTMQHRGQLIALAIEGSEIHLELPSDDHAGLVIGLGIEPLILTSPYFHPSKNLAKLPSTRVRMPDLSDSSGNSVRVTARGVFAEPGAPENEFPWSWETTLPIQELAIPTVPGYCHVEVNFGNKTSLWHGNLPVPNGAITLDFSNGFSAAGIVSNLPSSEAARCDVTVRLKADNPSLTLASSKVKPDGSWSISAIPWIPSSNYHFRLEHPGAVPTQFQAQPERPGINLEVFLEWSQGHPLAVLALTESGQPPEQMTIMAQWATDTGWSRQFAQTDTDGLANFASIPAGNTYLKTLASGFSDKAQGPFIIPTGGDAPRRITAHRTASISGSVRPQHLASDGFDIVYWQDTGSAEILQVGRNTDGYFEIEDIQLGQTYVMARSKLGSSAKEAVISPGSIGARNVDLLLSPSALVSGKVVDHSTGLALHGATVQPIWLSENGTNVGNWGSPTSTNSDGRFGNLPIPSSGTTLWVSHPTMAPSRVALAGPVRTGATVPLIRLLPYQAFSIQLHSSTGNLTNYWFTPTLLEGAKTTQFPASGLLIFPKCVSAPRVHFEVHTPSNSLLELTAPLASQRTEPYTLVINNSRNVIVDYSRVRQKGLNGPVQVRSSYINNQGMSVTHTHVPPNASTEFIINDIPRTSCVFRLFHEADIVSTTSVNLQDMSDTRVVLDLTPRIAAISLRPEPADNLYQAHAWLEHSTAPGVPLKSFIDQGNRLDTYNFELGSAELHVLQQTPPALFQATVEIRREGEEEQVIPFAPESSLVVRFSTAVDRPLQFGFSPLGTSYVNLYVPMGGPDSPPPVRLTPGTYSWRLDEPGYWPEAGALQAKPGLNELAVSARQVGSLQVHGPSGTSIAVYSEADDHLITEWRDLVPSTEVDVIPLNGSLVLPQLPEGPYRAWPSNASDPNPVDFEVHPGTSTEITIQF